MNNCYIRALRDYKVTDDEISIMGSDGFEVEYLTWQVVSEILDDLTDGNWNTTIIKTESRPDKSLNPRNKKVEDTIIVTAYVMLEVQCGEHTHYRTSVGTIDKHRVMSVLSSPEMVAERKAFKRAATQFGIGAHLEEGD